MMRLLRVVLKVSHIISDAEWAKEMRRLLRSSVRSFPALCNVGGLLCLLYFVYSIVGVSMFFNVKYQGYINSHAHFQAIHLYRHASM